MEGRVLENFQKNTKFFKIPKTTKIVPKCIQTSFDVFWGKLFEKFLPNFPWKVESSKIFKKKSNFSNFQKLSKYQKFPKSFQKVSKRILNVFCGKFFEKFLPSFPWKVESSKIFKKIKLFNFPKTFKISKMPKIVPKSIQTYFERLLRQIFRKVFAQFSTVGRVFENFQKNTEIFKFPKTTKIVPKCIQTCFEHVLGQTFRKIFCPVFHGRSSLRKFSKKSKKLQNSKSAQNPSQKYPNVF